MRYGKLLSVSVHYRCPFCYEIMEIKSKEERNVDIDHVEITQIFVCNTCAVNINMWTVVEKEEK